MIFFTLPRPALPSVSRPGRCGCGTSFTILHPLHRNQTNPEMFIGLVTETPERLTDQKQRWIGLSADQEPLETQKGHVSTTQCHRALAPALIGKIVAPEVPGLLEQPFAFSHTLSKNMAQSWHLESRMCQAVKLHPCSACFALSIAFGCEREAPACFIGQECYLFICFGNTKKIGMAPQPFA